MSGIWVRPRRYEAGFTLIELMIALALGLFLVGAILLVFQTSRLAALDAAQLSRLQENVRFASDYLVRDIRNAGFRDETILKIGHERQIRKRYAEVLDNGARLRVRYAGTGHCAEEFDDFRIVENEYFWNPSDDTLRCRGRSIADAAVLSESDRTNDGDLTINGVSQSFVPIAGVPLVSGVTGLSFETFCVGSGPCVCDLVDQPTDPDNLCHGVRIVVTFDGLRDGSGGFDQRNIELVSVFRNLVLERIGE